MKTFLHTPSFHRSDFSLATKPQRERSQPVDKSRVGPLAKGGKTKSRWKQLACTGLLLLINASMLSIMSLPFQPFRSYYLPPPIQGRQIQYLNHTLMGTSSLPALTIETPCPPLFFKTIPNMSLSATHTHEDFCEHVSPALSSARPAFHLQLASQQSEQGLFLKRLKNLGFENLTQSPNSKGTTGSTLLYDRNKKPIGIYKTGVNIGDFIARRLTASSRHVHCPQAVQVYFSSSSHGKGPCELGSLTEYIPHIKREALLPASPASHFANVSTASLQASAALHLLINDRDPHADNVLVRLDGTLESIDHDNSIDSKMLYDFVSLIRSGKENLMPNKTARPIILNRPFWMETQIVDRVRQPMDPQVAQWILSLEVQEAIGTLSQPIVDFLQTRNEVLKTAVREGVFLPDLYSYLTPHSFYLLGVLHDWDRDVETILDDYTTAIQLTARSFDDLTLQSDDMLLASFHYHFKQIVALRMNALKSRCT